jgi:S-adenosylmethionine hydrolase
MKPCGIVTMTTDFGLSDHYQGVMKGVILSLNPKCNIVDITHNISKYSIAQGNYILSSSFEIFPEGTVHLAVVDPGVGSKRAPLIIETKRHFFVGPDNGLFSFIDDDEITGIYKIESSEKIISSTFHGRDIFAPVAANLSKGLLPEILGTIINVFNRNEFEKPCYTSEQITGRIIHIDSFGNLISNIDANKTISIIGNKSFIADIKKYSISYIFETYDKAGNHLFLISGSGGKIEISKKEDSAQSIIKASLNDSVIINIK